MRARVNSLRTAYQKMISQQASSGSSPIPKTARSREILRLCSFLHKHVKKCESLSSYSRAPTETEYYSTAVSEKSHHHVTEKSARRPVGSDKHSTKPGTDKVSQRPLTEKNSRRTGSDPRRPGSDSQQPRRAAGSDPRRAGSDPRRAGSDPRRPGSDSQQPHRAAGSDPRRPEIEPRRAGTDRQPSKGADIEGRFMSRKPLFIKVR